MALLDPAGRPTPGLASPALLGLACLALLVLPADTALAVGDSQTLSFAEASLEAEIDRRIDRAPRGRLGWIYLDRQVVRGPLLRSPGSILVTRELSSRTAEMVEVNGRGMVRRRKLIQGRIRADPVLDAFGRLVLVTTREVMCLDRELRQVWKTQLPQPAPRSPATSRNGSIMMPFRSNGLALLDRKGRLQRTVRLPATSPPTPSLDARGGFYVCTGSVGTLERLSSQGKRLWSQRIGKCSHGPLVTPSGMVVLASEGRINAYDEQGKLRWQLATAGRGGRPVLGHGGDIYVATTAGLLVAITARGRLRWTFPIGRSKNPPVPAVGPGGEIYVASPAGYLLVLSVDGRIRWHRRVARPGPNLAVRFDGGVLALSSKRSLLLVLPPAARSRPKS